MGHFRATKVYERVTLTTTFGLYFLNFKLRDNFQTMTRLSRALIFHMYMCISGGDTFTLPPIFFTQWHWQWPVDYISYMLS